MRHDDAEIFETFLMMRNLWSGYKLFFELLLSNSLILNPAEKSIVSVMKIILLGTFAVMQIISCAIAGELRRDDKVLTEIIK